MLTPHNPSSITQPIQHHTVSPTEEQRHSPMPGDTGC